MNPTEQKIFDIIRADVCGQCPSLTDGPLCRKHQPRCHAGYERQAKAIYAEIVKPLEQKP